MLVLFDLDDTLIDHTTAYRSATASLQQAVGFQLPFEELMARWSAAHRRHFDQFLLGNLTYEEQARARVREAIEPSLCDTDADRCFSRYIEAYEQAWSLFPDVEPCLQGLGGHRLGVVSNGQRAQQVSKLVRTGIFDRFECVVVPRDSGCPKPHAGIFYHACTLAGELPERVAYVATRTTSTRWLHGMPASWVFGWTGPEGRPSSMCRP